jgi:hypothetical protein
MKLSELHKLIEASSKDINDDILDHNLKADFDETTDEVQKDTYEGNKKKIDHTSGKLPPKKQRGNDRLLFKEDMDGKSLRRVIDDMIVRSNEITADQANYPLPPATKWVIIDNQTKKPVSKILTNRSRARSRADKLDLQYGAVRYRVMPLYENVEELEVPEKDEKKKTKAGPVKMSVVHEYPDGKQVLMLGGKGRGEYESIDKAMRIFRNFWYGVLDSEVNGPPKLLKYNNDSLVAAAEGPQGEYLVKVTGLKDFDDVKAFHALFKDGLG